MTLLDIYVCLHRLYKRNYIRDHGHIVYLYIFLIVYLSDRKAENKKKNNKKRSSVRLFPYFSAFLFSYSGMYQMANVATPTSQICTTSVSSLTAARS